MKKILVTGAAGFIGFHLCQALLDAGHEVIGMDNLNEYYSPELKRARTYELLAHPAYHLLPLNVANRDACKAIFREILPDMVCHLAAQAGVRYSLENASAYQESNLAGFVQLIDEVSRTRRIKRFVYASSSSVYGGNTKLPFSETDPVDTPVSLYGATKRANELIAYAYSHIHGLQTIGLRLFTVYGPWGRPDMAYWSFLDRISHGEPIQLYNNGNNRRDFTYIDDIIPAIVAAMMSDGLDLCEVINLGNSDPVDVLTLVDMVEELAHAPAKKELVPAQPGDVETTFADITRAREKLGFNPKTSLKDGLQSFASWYWKHLDLVKRVRAHERRNPWG
jgi:UDP-glucuronate 4-epimerase